jgi:hypothetical protein
VWFRSRLTDIERASKRGKDDRREPAEARAQLAPLRKQAKDAEARMRRGLPIRQSVSLSGWQTSWNECAIGRELEEAERNGCLPRRR